MKKLVHIHSSFITHKISRDFRVFVLSLIPKHLETKEILQKRHNNERAECRKQLKNLNRARFCLCQF